MRPGILRSRPSATSWRGSVVIGCAALLVTSQFTVLAQGTAPAPTASAAPAATEPAAAKLPPEQLDSLVAPVALYPDSLLAQTLVAATYPLEIVQLQQWLAKNKGLKDKALVDAVAKQPWDPAIQSMAAVPDVVKRLADDIQWTTDLGNAFLAQQGEVMDAVQRMRKKAKDKGALESNEQQKVETQVIEEKTVIVVESADPEVVYVPSYSPTVVYGASPYYPYPPIYYPPYYPGGAFVAFSFGVMIGAAWGGACCGFGWGGNDIDINVNNNFNRNEINHNRGSGNRQGGGGRQGSGGRQGGGGQKWQHNPQHRGAAPYGDRATANKFGGSTRGQSASARQQPGGGGSRGASAGSMDRSAGGSRASSSAGSMDRSAGGSRSSSAGASSMDRGGGGSDRIGSQNVQRSNSSKASGFGGGSSGYSGSSARASSSRGASSMGSRGGGGRGGGGRRR